MSTDPTLVQVGPQTGPEVAANAPVAAALFMTPRFPRVNLLPPQVLAGRRLLRTQRLLAAGLACVVLAVGGAFWVEHASVGRSEQALARSKARAAALNAEAVPFAEAPVVLAQVDRARNAQAQAMASDVRWYQLIDAISRQTPAGVWITDVSISGLQASSSSASSAAGSAATGAGAATTAAGGADPLAKPAIATITIKGYGLAPQDVARWLDALTAVPGLSDARYSTSSSVLIGSRSVTTFNSSVGVTSALLSHRFDLARS